MPLKRILIAMALVLGLQATPAHAQPSDTPAAAPTEGAAPAPAPEEKNTEPAPAGETQPPAGDGSETTKAETPEDGEAKAAKADKDGESLGTLGTEALELAKAGKWVAAVGVALLLLVSLLRRFVFGKVKWFQSKIGGYAMAGGMMALTFVGLGLKTGMWADALPAALSAGGLAMGLHTATSDVKKSRAKT